MDALDGNAIAGPLFEHFGLEMTTATGACTHCGTRAQIAELCVYPRAPGTVVRCRMCEGIVMVLVVLRGAAQVHFPGFDLAEPPAG